MVATEELAQDKVLIIDDDRGPRESLRILLKNDFSVLCAASVDEGVEMLQRERPSAIVMDIRMPGKNGIDGLREIRNLDGNVSVIMLTGHGSLETAQDAIRLGASDYLRKPFDTQEMLKLIRRHVSSTHAERRRTDAESRLQSLSQRVNGQLAVMNRMASLGLASSELVHDLRNPISVAQGYLELLSLELRQRAGANGALPPDLSDYLEKMERNLQRCTELIEVWQSMGRADDRRIGKVDLLEAVEEIVTEVRRLQPHADVRRVVDPGSAALESVGDALQIGRALRNIVVNAAQAVAPETGCVLVRCKADADTVTVDVQDNGCGIDPAQIQQVFDPFFTSKKGRKGTGLGLFIAATIIKDHGGKIDIYSRLGEGTTVRVQLPKQPAVGS